MSKLITSLFHFNHINLLIKPLVNRLLSKNDSIREICETTISEILSSNNPAQLVMKCQIVKEMQHLINSVSEDRLPTNFIDNLILLEIESLPEPEKVISKKRKRKEEYLAKKESKTSKPLTESKKQKKIEEKELSKKTKKELEESKAEFDVKFRRKHCGMLLEKSFAVFFRILKRTNSKFFPSTLKGILKFIHMIKVDVMFETLKLLYAIAKDNKTKIEFRLKAVDSAAEIFYGPGIALELDSSEMNKALYKIMLDIKLSAQKEKGKLNEKVFAMLLQSINFLFITKKQFSNPCIASFIIMMAMLSRDLIGNYSELAGELLAILRKFFLRYPRARNLLDEDDFDYFSEPKIEDPYALESLNISILPLLKEIKVKAGKNNEIVGHCTSMLSKKWN